MDDSVTWKHLYKAAMEETNPLKVHDHIHIARVAIARRKAELEQQRHNNPELRSEVMQELIDIANALTELIRQERLQPPRHQR
jgi:hypothetical protein